MTIRILLFIIFLFAYEILASEKLAHERNEDFELATKIIAEQIDGKTMNDAFTLLIKAAKTGHPGAINNIGYFYESGQIVQKDLAKAIKYYEHASKLGNIDAQFNLGKILLDSKDPNRYQEALDLLSDASHSHPWAAYLWSNHIIDQNHSTETDKSLAIDRLYDSALKRDIRAMFFLGRLYYEGRILEHSLVDSWVWFDLAVRHGHKGAYKAASHVAEKMSVNMQRIAVEQSLRMLKLNYPEKLTVLDDEKIITLD